MPLSQAAEELGLEFSFLAVSAQPQHLQTRGWDPLCGMCRALPAEGAMRPGTFSVTLVSTPGITGWGVKI